jgi:HSP90 family molecular chaperone
MAETTGTNDRFTFEISLSVLNHLGRNLYRSFVTVLGEAISNSWDANAENVHIYVDREKADFTIKDDGIGMSRDDFQNKFLKIGYSKRKNGETKSPGKDRPYI